MGTKCVEYKKVISFFRIVTAVFVCGLLSLFAGCGHKAVSFDQARWKDAKKRVAWELRKKMAADLINKRVLIGLDRAAVIQKLGKPEEYADTKKTELYYLIDSYYGSDIDPIRIEHLIVEFGTNNRVVKIYRKLSLDEQ